MSVFLLDRPIVVGTVSTKPASASTDSQVPGGATPLGAIITDTIALPC